MASGGGTLRLWAIGNVGDDGPISSVKLSVAYAHGDTPTVSLSPTLAGGTGSYNGFTDSSVAAAATYLRTVTDGSAPTFTGGEPLPSHGIFGPGTDWQEFLLGDFTMADSPSGDFIDSLPTAIPVGDNSHPGSQINVYDVMVTGTGEVHFDLYDSIISGNHIKYVKAPFSHDADGGNNVPDGGATFLLMGLGWLGIQGLAKKFKKA